jgi:hypothetical protein
MEKARDTITRQWQSWSLLVSGFSLLVARWPAEYKFASLKDSRKRR